MQLGRVTGTVVATDKVAGLEGVRFLIVQPLDKHEHPVGRPLVAADAVPMAGARRAGLLRCLPGGGRGARRALCRSITPSSASSIRCIWWGGS